MKPLMDQQGSGTEEKMVEAVQGEVKSWVKVQGKIVDWRRNP
jgi:Ni,Fe-hydrogenase III large subunit